MWKDPRVSVRYRFEINGSKHLASFLNNYLGFNRILLIDDTGLLNYVVDQDIDQLREQREDYSRGIIIRLARETYETKYIALIVVPNISLQYTGSVNIRLKPKYVIEGRCRCLKKIIVGLLKIFSVIKFTIEYTTPYIEIKFK